jgi:hypothetical protein
LMFVPFIGRFLAAVIVLPCAHHSAAPARAQAAWRRRRMQS